MNNYIRNNSFGILGFDNSVSQRDIIKRGKEIIKLLKIDVTPDYYPDLALISKERNEGNVNQAIKDLQVPKKLIANYFFWFDLSNEEDRKVFAVIHQPKAKHRAQEPCHDIADLTGHEVIH